MYIQSWELLGAADAAPARKELFRRMAARLALSYTCKLDQHLADDAGQHSYSVPLFAPRQPGRGNV